MNVLAEFERKDAYDCDRYSNQNPEISSLAPFDPLSKILIPSPNYTSLDRLCSSSNPNEKSRCFSKVVDWALAQKNVNVPFITYVIQSIPDEIIQNEAYQKAKKKNGFNELEMNSHSMR